MAERKITCSDGVDRVPGIYRGESDPIFGLWRLKEDGRWLFCMPVKGSRWRLTDQLPKDPYPMNDPRSIARHDPKALVLMSPSVMEELLGILNFYDSNSPWADEKSDDLEALLDKMRREVDHAQDS